MKFREHRFPIILAAFTYQTNAGSDFNTSAIISYSIWAGVFLLVLIVIGVTAKWYFDKKHLRDIFLRNRSTSHIVQNLSGRGFEQWVTQLLLSVGAKAKTTGRQGDHGIDVVAEYQGRKIGIQCKKYDQWLVGEPAVRDLYGVKWHNGFDKVILITSGNFSWEALAWAKGKPDLILINQQLLERIIADRQILRGML